MKRFRSQSDAMEHWFKRLYWRLEVLFRILQVFGMNVADFFGERIPAPAEEERELLDAFRSMPAEKRQEVLDFARFKLSQEEAAGNE